MMKEDDVVTVGILKEILNETFGLFSDRFKAIDMRFDAIDKRFDKIDKRLDGMDGRIDSNFDLLNDKIDKVAAGLEFKISFEAGKLSRRIDQVDRSSKRRDEEIMKRLGGPGLTKSEWLGDEEGDEEVGEPVRI